MVLGVLGCPNLPMAALTEEDGARRVAPEGDDAGRVGVCFVARRGGGAFYGPLYQGEKIRCSKKLKRKCVCIYVCICNID